jgi:phage tail-like protein
MANTTRTDPIRNFKFEVQIQPRSSSALQSVFSGAGLKMGFAVVSGLAVQNEMIAYREGGMNTHPHKMVGQSDFSPVTFSKGVFAGQRSLYQWQQFLHSWSSGSLGDLGSTSADNDYRCDIVVSVFDHPVSAGNYDSTFSTSTATPSRGNIKLAYKLFSCWPGSYALTDLEAGSSSIMIQQLVVHHEGFEVQFADDAPGAAVDMARFASIT